MQPARNDMTQPTATKLARITRLDDRGVISVVGGDAEKFLQGLLTNSVDALAMGHAAHAALLSPQGKILFDFFVVKTFFGFLLDVAADKAADLVKRLQMYKLRAAVEIRDETRTWCVWAGWTEGSSEPGDPHIFSLEKIEFLRAQSYADPRLPALGARFVFHRDTDAQVQGDAGIDASPASAYHAHRIALGVPEGGKDYDFGDAYPHEADFDIFNGVSFTKGCYVGQEIVARMQHKTVVRKRVVPVTGDRDLPTDRPDVVAGDVPIGRLGSVAALRGLAMLRLDRAADAAGNGIPLMTGNVQLRIDPPQWLVMPKADTPAQTQ